MSHHEKFSEKALRALSSQNLTWEGVESAGGEEKDAPKRRGFRDGMDFRLGAIEQLTERKRERERKTRKKVPTQLISIRRKKLVRMHEKCMNM